MNNIQSNIDRFNRELTSLQQVLVSWGDELAATSTQVLREKETITKQRLELIQKSNLIVEQVNGLRGQKEKSDEKMLEAEKLKKSAVGQLEQAETMLGEARLKENEVELREKNIKLLEEREKRVKEKEESLTQQEDKVVADRAFLKKELELLDEKQQVLVIREKNLDIREAKQKRIMSDI